MRDPIAETPDQERFLPVFRHLPAVTALARRRGSPDAEALAAEVMAVAWRRLDAVPLRDPLPWLLATACNLRSRRSARRCAARRRATPAPSSSSRASTRPASRPSSTRRSAGSRSPSARRWKGAFVDLQTALGRRPSYVVARDRGGRVVFRRFLYPRARCTYPVADRRCAKIIVHNG
jgi:DNA-directed RNA polymerase specialized sigma24 family protein